MNSSTHLNANTSPVGHQWQAPNPLTVGGVATKNKIKKKPDSPPLKTSGHEEENHRRGQMRNASTLTRRYGTFKTKAIPDCSERLEVRVLPLSRRK